MLRARAETGGTYRILVHRVAIGHPVYTETPYGNPIAGEHLRLHAEILACTHPVSGEELEFEAGMPGDLRVSAATLGFEA